MNKVYCADVYCEWVSCIHQQRVTSFFQALFCDLYPHAGARDAGNLVAFRSSFCRCCWTVFKIFRTHGLNTAKVEPFRDISLAVYAAQKFRTHGLNSDRMSVPSVLVQPTRFTWRKLASCGVAAHPGTARTVCSSRKFAPSCPTCMCA